MAESDFWMPEGKPARTNGVCASIPQGKHSSTRMTDLSHPMCGARFARGGSKSPAIWQAPRTGTWRPHAGSREEMGCFWCKPRLTQKSFRMAESHAPPRRMFGKVPGRPMPRSSRPRWIWKPLREGHGISRGKAAASFPIGLRGLGSWLGSECRPSWLIWVSGTLRTWHRMAPHSGPRTIGHAY